MATQFHCNDNGITDNVNDITNKEDIFKAAQFLLGVAGDARDTDADMFADEHEDDSNVNFNQEDDVFSPPMFSRSRNDTPMHMMLGSTNFSNIMTDKAKNGDANEKEVMDMDLDTHKTRPGPSSSSLETRAMRRSAGWTSINTPQKKSTAAREREERYAAAVGIRRDGEMEIDEGGELKVAEREGEDEDMDSEAQGKDTESNET